MSEAKGCFGWIAATIGWWILWGLCMSFGDIYKISPFFVLFMLIIGVLVIVVIVVISILAYYSIIDLLYTKHEKRVKHIQKEYHSAFMQFIYSNGIKIDKESGKISELSELKMISSREDSVWEQEEKLCKEEAERIRKKREEEREKAKLIKKEYPDGYKKWFEKPLNYPLFNFDHFIVNEEKEIALLDKHVKSEKWEKEQKEFSSLCYESSEKYLPKYGRYSYNIPFTKYDVNGKEIKGNYEVWQLFYRSMCLKALDYTNCPYYKTNAEKVPELEKGTRHYEPDVYNDIANFIKEIAKYYCKDNNDSISVIFNYEKDWDEEVLDSHYDPLEELLSDHRNINCDDTSLFEDDYWLDSFDKINIIVDIVTENDDMKRLCQKIISLNEKFHPVIVYISLMKAHDRQEMLAIIDKENERQAKIREEKEKEEKAKKSLIECVGLWDTLLGGLKYTYLFYYYPTTCDFEANEEEWDNRRTVWNFKNNPERISPSVHTNTLNKVIPMIKTKLLSTFSEESLKYLTLVCIPASSQSKTEARYEEFSSRICEELGMINAFPHITVTEERLEKHLGGTNTDTDKLSFDEDFFKGKYILLFDDVITRGDSMRSFKRRMEELGATVVGGLCIGRTKHERDIPSPFESTKPDMAFPPRFESNKPDEIIRPPFDLLF